MARPLILAAALVAGVLAAVPAASAAVVGSSSTTAVVSAPSSAPSLCPDAESATFGPNVCVFTPSMTQAAIQADLERDLDPAGAGRRPVRQRPVLGVLRAGHLRVRRRPAGLPGRLLHAGRGPRRAAVGHRRQRRHRRVQQPLHRRHPATATPTTTSGGRCPTWTSTWTCRPRRRPTRRRPSTPYGAGCANSAEIWAASQAAPIRRAIINGSVVFQDYCATNNYASGGFIADSQISGDLDFYGNQQYMVRNSSIGGANGCPNGLWNMVYSGVEGAPAPVFTGQCAAEHRAGRPAR